MPEKTIPIHIEICEECYTKMQTIKEDYEYYTKSRVNFSEVIEASIRYYYEKLYGEKHETRN